MLPPLDERPEFFVNTNEDELASALDALFVINFLGRSPSGESEPTEFLSLRALTKKSNVAVDAHHDLFNSFLVDHLF